MLTSSQQPNLARRPAHTRAVLLLVAGVLIFVTFGWLYSRFDPYDGGSNHTDTARMTITMLENAARHFNAKYNRPPMSLVELVEPQEGNRPLVDGGSNSILDPWGKPYRYDSTHTNKHGEFDPIVYTVHPDGKILVSHRRR